jgi:phosphate transport system substrate-binding protein
MFAAALFVAACGDSDDDGSTDTTEGASSETTAAETTEGGSSETTAAETTEGGSSETTAAPTETGGDAAGGAGEPVSGEVFVSGSSTVEPVSIRVAELMEESQPDVSVTVEGPGTGDGFVKFCAGETDISDASRPISDEEMATCADAGIEYTELKIAIDGLAVLTHPNNADVQCLTIPDMYALVGPESQGFANWSDAQALATELGSTTTFPDAELLISAPGTESGTYDSFVELVIADIAEERTQEETTRPDYASSADDNIIITTIEGDEGSFGWVGFAFAAEAGDAVKVLEVDGGDGCVAATPETIASNEYPLSRDLYIYVNNAKAAENPAIGAYVDFYLTDDGLGTAVSEVGYVELADESKEETRAAWAG